MKTLPETFTKGGFFHRQIRREGDLAIYSRGDHFEVIRIRSHKGGVVLGREIPPGELYPSSEQWGVYGWTYNERGAADAKFAELLANQCPYCGKFGHSEEETACPQRVNDADRFVSMNAGTHKAPSL